MGHEINCSRSIISYWDERDENVEWPNKQYVVKA